MYITFEMVLIINKNFNIVFESIYMKIIKSVCQVKFQKIRI